MNQMLPKTLLQQPLWDWLLEQSCLSLKVHYYTIKPFGRDWIKAPRVDTELKRNWQTFCAIDTGSVSVIQWVFTNFSWKYVETDMEILTHSFINSFKLLSCCIMRSMCISLICRIYALICGLVNCMIDCIREMLNILKNINQY